MKHTINLFASFLLLLIFTVSCVDDSIDFYHVEKPESIAELEYLNDYDFLKSYVDRNANPNFKLGAAVNVGEYLELGHYYRLVNANFDAMTADNAMKYSSVVGDNGAMNFGPIEQFVAAARDAGMGIYGHTLVWHSQQNKRYLESLIADREIEIDPDDANPGLVVSTPNANAFIWDWQLNYVLPEALVAGVSYTIKLRAKASTAYTVAFWRFDGSATNYGPDFAVGEDWGDVIINFTPTINATTLQFNFGTFGGKLYFDDIVLTASGSEVNLVANGSFDEETLIGWQKPGWHAYTFGIERAAAGPAVWYTQLVNNGNIEGNDLLNFVAIESRSEPGPAVVGAPGTGADGVGRAIVVQSGDNPVNDWDTQFFVTVPYTFQVGDRFRFSMKYKADKAAIGPSQAHLDPTEYNHWEFVGTLNFTTGWQTHEFAGVINANHVGGDQRGVRTIAFNLAVLKEANTYYFDDISWELEESGNKIPLTPQEKADTLTYALRNWISGMMRATDGYVTEWDVVNEPLAGRGHVGEGFYDLKSAVRGTVSAADALNSFYWQDYLGVDYVRLAVKLAREYGPNNLKLFVNDYNLESDWDDNHKLKSLIYWINRWESDGVTVIDGIGTQMHISYYMDPVVQASKEEHIVQMFELLAQTGKLIRITELDMGLVDENGQAVKTPDVTNEQHKAMSDHYQFIIRKYFEIIPPNQRYGITQWCITDSPETSFWRAGEPVGLWTERTYRRKHTYGGFADGLSGK